MNQQQILGALRIILPALLAFAAGGGWIEHNSIPDITAAILTIVATVWSIATHTHANAVAVVAALPSTDVSRAGNVITIHDPVLAQSAKDNATPLSAAA